MDPRSAALALALTIGLGCVAPPRELAPGPRNAVDHALWDGLLRAHVRDGVVDYPALCPAPGRTRYLEQLATAHSPVDAPVADRLALLMNGYNALAIDLVCQGRSPETLLGRYGFFMRERVEIAGEAITLWDLEQEHIRPIGEPRIHFAIVCASSSCPKLASQAFVPGRLDAQLDTVTRAFVNDPTRNRFDPDAGRAELSKIFSWYEEDFGITAESDAGADVGPVGAWIAPWLEDQRAAAALLAGELDIGSLPYDWSLNGPRPGED